MAAQLNSTVYVTDPDSHQTVELASGTSPEPRLAALVTNPAAWVDGKLPRLPKTKESSPDGPDDNAAGNGQDDASGAASDDSGDADTETDKPAATAATKTAAKKTAASRSRGRTAADEGTSGE